MTAGKSPNPKIYQLKVTLKYVKPPIWRRFQVRSDIRLATLHDILQYVMGWVGGHLYQFDAEGVDYGDRVSLDDPDVVSVHTARLNNVLRREGSKCTYLYDFGDGWEHVVLLEKILAPEPGAKYPVCITGKRNCPPEDCGGVPGYCRLLEALADPEDAENAELLEWMGGEFDPEAFDCDEVNSMLSRTVVLKKPKGG